jgi:tetratricopeptide (TPR) repeat protein
MRGFIGIFAALVCAGASLAAPETARAQGPTPASPSGTTGRARSGDPKAEALRHFERARELYRDGNYREAIVELESAQSLDPEAKDLVYNLALVHEKLAQIDDALRWMHRYAAMDLDADERARSDSTIRRLEGAKKTLAEAKPEEPAPPAPSAPVAATPTPMGRIDAWTLATGAAAVVGLGVGTIFGISALSSRPKSGFVTGESGSYADLEDQARSAHTRAVIADVGFGVFVASAAACTLLYFTRTRDAEATRSGAPQTRARGWSMLAVAPSASGATVLMTGALP